MLSSHISDFLRNFRTYDAAVTAADQSGEVIRVHAVTSRLGGLYERMRYFVDHKEEHTIRRSAIERMLKRKMVFEQQKEIGRSLVHELVSAGYLPNQNATERAGAEVQRIARTYMALERGVRSRTSDPKVLAPIISLAASEIEALWYATAGDDLIAKTFYESVRPQITGNDGALSADELNEQVYVACRRTLLRNDDQAIRYAFWCDVRSQPADENLSVMPAEDEGVSASVERYLSFAEQMKNVLNHPIAGQLTAKLRNHAIYFTLVREMAEAHGAAAERIMGDPKLLARETEQLLKPKYEKANQRARQSGIRAVIYIMCTKILLAVGGELPYEFFILHAVNYPALAINIVFHPMLLLIMTWSIAPLGAENTRLILEGMREILYGENLPADRHGQQPIRLSVKKSKGALHLFFGVCYAVLVCAVFGLIAWGLYRLHFNPISAALFLFFLTVVSYLGFRVRYTAQQWRVRISEDEGGLALFASALTLPIVRVGRWMSKTFSSINLLIFVMDFIIETPFKLLLKFFDGFLSFLKEKKEETY